MKSSHKVKISVGATTILMIFVVLCLTTFAVLSFLTARSDLKLTSKSVTATKEYYQADAKVEEWLGSVDDFLSLASKSAKIYVQNGVLTNLPIGEIPQEKQAGIKSILSNDSYSKEKKENEVYRQFQDLAVYKLKNIAIKPEPNAKKSYDYIVKVNDNFEINVKLLLSNLDETKRYQVVMRKLISLKQWEQEQVEV
ncbi:hypothetical protein RBG61_10030 [Paludicola sp. MB14-C6]|uniref:hypothetical protein n=1 Tax=Paludihabitans sp. MB14-C6 TaxID=3070656 RepID=UPI0027DB628D|nr:hypothetical protein [Paludicola sp. MB14-C6]WMJ22325.1 hypothetical protein RBG61_10030 [Paludicola sp. MB14-C6]